MILRQAKVFHLNVLHWQMQHTAGASGLRFGARRPMPAEGQGHRSSSADHSNPQNFKILKLKFNRKFNFNFHKNSRQGSYVTTQLINSH